MLSNGLKIKNIYLFSVLASFASFTIYFISSVLLSNIGFAYYVSYFASRLIESSLPVLCAVCVFVNSGSYGTALLPTLYYSLTRLAYVIPYTLLLAISSGYYLGATLLYTFLESLVYLVTYFAEGVILYFVISLFYKRLSRSCTKEPIPVSALDLDSPLALSVLFASLLRFVFNLVLEIIDTVEYLTDYAGDYRAWEIIYMVVSFIFILFIMLLTFYLSARMLNTRTYSVEE